MSIFSSLIYTMLVTVSGGATDSTDTLQPLKKIIVCANQRETDLKEIPGIAYVIDNKDLSAIKAHRASEALSYIPGVDIEAGTGVGLPFKKNVAINGLPSFHTMVLVDGKRLFTSHFHTGINVDMIPAENIERIEILKDASCALYGSDALGGVINIVTKRGSSTPVIDVHGSGGSRKTGRTGVSIRSQTKEGILYNAYAGWERSDGPALTTGSRKDKLDYRQFTLMDRVDIPFGNDILLGISCDFTQHFDVPQGNATFDSWLVTPALDFSWHINKTLSLFTKVYYSQWNADQSVEKNEIGSPKVYLTYSGIPQNFVTGGVDYAWRNFSRTGVKEHDQYFTGVFLQDEITLFEIVKLLGAIRMDYVDNTVENSRDIGPHFSPKLSVLANPGSFISARFGIGTGFRAPHVQDLYESRYHPSEGGIWRYGNPDLKPENSFSVNGGIDLKPLSFLNCSVYGYYNKLDDMIAVVRAGRDTVYNNKTIPVLHRVNINDYTINGIDASVSFRKGYFGLETGGSASWQKSDDKKAEGALLFPGQKAFVKADANYPLSSKLSLNGFAGVHRVFNRTAPNGGTALKDYTNLDAGISASIISRYELYFKAKNLLGQEMQVYEDALWTLEGEPLFEGGIKMKIF